jgi:hypothetical protein
MAATIFYFSVQVEIGKGNADCKGCGSQWDNRQPAPVRSFAPNRFGLYDMSLSGSKIACTTIMTAHQRMVQHGPETATATGIRFAAAPGSTIQGASAPPIATGTPPVPGAAASVSGWGDISSKGRRIQGVRSVLVRRSLRALAGSAGRLSLS